MKAWYDKMLTGPDLSKEIKNMSKKLNDTAEQMEEFDLMGDMGCGITKISEEPEMLPSPEIVLGRDEEQNEIVNLIIGDWVNDRHSVIPIIGMDGLGKTTLARLIFNNERLKDHVDLGAWVYVSKDFDQHNIERLILESLNNSEPGFYDQDWTSSELKKALSGRRCLLVLDDVRNINMNSTWEKLEMLMRSSYTSTILVTTRTEKTAEYIATHRPYYLRPLTFETCMSLLLQRVFKSTHEMNNYPNLVEVGKKIVKKCEGVALTVNTLGTILRFRRDEKFWKHLNVIEMRKLHADKLITLPTSKKQIFPTLMLSYNYMPAELKPCFAYYSTLPKGYKIDRKKLVQHWISLNLIRPSHFHTLEDIAQVYLHELISMSFLQKCPNRAFEKQDKVVVMDYLVHDLAQLLMKDGYFKFVTDEESALGGNITYPNAPSAYGLRKSSKLNEFVKLGGTLRALHLQNDLVKTSENSFTELTSLFVLEVEGQSTHQLESIQKSEKLRCFSASRLENFPDITNLPSLQYLRLQRIYGTVPEAFGNHKNLQFLQLSYCKLHVALPECITNLENLVHLELENSDNDDELPKSLGNLKSLKYLMLSSYYKTLPESTGHLRNLVHLEISYCFQNQ